MSDARDRMVGALKEFIVPDLRRRGFVGSFPHFRRTSKVCIDMMTFQFDRYGGGFVIEVGQCGLEGLITSWGKQIPPDKVRAWDLSIKQRKRIQPGSDSGTEGWFRYDAPDGSSDIYSHVAQSVLPFLAQAENMFSSLTSVGK